ncbi:MAG: adenylate/guanylate cyclase domain-containing protein [Gallionella sp.]|nr:adenylate/guanylate cyclase domain-containing protein [Gallionella sp.]MDD4947503.1 adenylate/guanylate cyclase domain-containing protein [Gallionella sp.]MDD5613118.1 adenylate/guanylate cyclase domain-containing protein [Gallionella sp.]
MSISKLYEKFEPYLAALTTVFIVTILVSAIYFTEIDKQWTVFLSGVLIASIFGLVSRSSRAEWLNTRSTEQIALLKDRLEQEVILREASLVEQKELVATLRQTEGAFGRLIPHQLLELMGRDSVLDVELGDQFERKLTIMSTDIREFTHLSENMTPQENFDFLNAYFAQMEPVIGEHGGVIDKYMGDSILALFTRAADDALHSAIDMLEKLEKYNAGRTAAGYAPLQIGIGLNTGLVMIGTVGGPNRMETTVIGDAVNLTNRIEGACKTYYTPLLISQNTLYNLAIPGKYDIRFLDRIRVKGKTQPLSIYEVFDNDPIKIRDGKRADKQIFEAAIAYYHVRNIDKAKELLETCIKNSPKDIPAHIYLSRCKQYLTTGQHFTTGELNTQLEWRKEFQTHVHAIDHAHRQLFNKTNELIAASITAINTGEIDGLRLIFDYLASHLIESRDEEEQQMAEYKYPFIEEHVREHKRFIEDFTAIKEEMDSNNFDLTLLVFRTQILLFDWFNSHIAQSDRHATRHIIRTSPTEHMGAITLRLRAFLMSDAHTQHDLWKSDVLQQSDE